MGRPTGGWLPSAASQRRQPSNLVRQQTPSNVILGPFQVPRTGKRLRSSPGECRSLQAAGRSCGRVSYDPYTLLTFIIPDLGLLHGYHAVLVPKRFARFADGFFPRNAAGNNPARLYGFTVICKKDCRSHFFALARGRVCTCFECGGGACAMSRRRTAAASLAYEIG